MIRPLPQHRAWPRWLLLTAIICGTSLHSAAWAWDGRPGAATAALAAPTASSAAPRPSCARRLFEAAKRVGSRIRLPEKWRRGIDAKVSLVRGHCTLAADRVESRLPRCLVPAFGKARRFSPVALGSYCAMKFKQDPAFLAVWGAGYGLLHNLEAPAMMAVGVPAPVAVAIQETLEIPVNLAVIATRQHHLRADRSQGFGGTLRALGREYVEHAETRRQENRDFMARRAQLKIKPSTP